MLAAVVGILASIAMPLLPVTQTVASISWPQYESGTSVSAPLVSYAPVDLEATIPCRSVQDLSSSGGTVFSTLPAGAPDRERYGLIARVRPGEDGPAMFEMISRNTMLVSAPVDELSGDCAVAVSSTPDRTIATASSSTRAAGQRSSDRDLRPQLVGIFTDLPGPALDGVSVTATVDTRFATSPTVLKVAAMAVAVLATRLALWTLHRLDRADGRRHRRVLPATWWSFTRIAAAVVGTLLLWHVIGANTADDGYQLGMARAAGEAGYMANYFRWFGVPEAPFGTPFYDVLAAMTQVSTASIWMRLPALSAGILCWWVLSREVAPRLGVALRRTRLPLWTGALVFLAFWLPLNNGLRPEPIVATGVLLAWCSVERASGLWSPGPINTTY